MKVAIVYGGYSPEWVISEKSAAVVLRHLRSEGMHCTLIRISEDAWTAFIDGVGEVMVDRNDFSVIVNGEHWHFDVVFNAIHGTPGEDGRLQGYFDMLRIPYTSPGVLASAITFNKALCNGYLRQYSDVHIANSIVLHREDVVKTDAVIAKVGLPCFVKPSCAGSSFGISKVKSAEELLPAIDFAFTHDSEVIIEQFVKGTEVSVGAYRHQGRTVALAGTEIETANEFFDYQAKYEGASREITPPRVSEKVSDALRQTTVRVFDRLGLKGMSRIDFIVNEAGQPFLIEVNTVPGLSEESILPQQVAHAGMTLGSFFRMLIEEAVMAK